MKKSIITVITALFILAAVSVCSAEEMTEQDARDIGVKFLERVRSNNVHLAVKLFHFPPYNEQSKMDDSWRALQGFITLLQVEFGGIKSFRFTPSPIPSAVVSIGTGTVKYWKEHPNYKRAAFIVEFKKEGTGTVFVDCCDVNGEIEIKDIHFGLPMTRPDAKERMKEVSKKLLIKLRK